MTQPQRRIPVAFLLTVLGGLGVGVGAGLALRYQPTFGSQPVSSSVPNLFGHKQVFPSQGDWPITEIPNLLNSEPKVEEPLYRTAPSPTYYTTPSYTTPIPQPYPYSDNINAVPSPSSTEAQSLPEVKPDRSPSYFATPKRSDVLPVNPEPRNQAIDAMPVPPSAASSAPSLPEFPSPISPSAPATGYPPASDLNTPAQMPKTLPAIEPPIVSQ